MMKLPRSDRHGDYGGTRACIKEWVWKIYPDDYCRRARFGRIFGEGVYPRTKKKRHEIGMMKLRIKEE
jgi:hypothetical protein